MTGIIILAAGASRRLGQPKQNLKFKGHTLLQLAIAAALGSHCRPVIVVIGANAEELDLPDSHPDVTIVQNTNWQQGMASSLKAGLNELGGDAAGVAVMLCDQPFVDAGLINRLLQSNEETGKAIIACKYKEVAGVPSLFDQSLFPKLMALKGDEGAKHLIKTHPADVFTIEFEAGIIDIDTGEDYLKLTGQNS